ncbi:DNA (cytosine-5-)-methyltransferase [Arcanobacterium phocisimile]|uniref:DNA (cytosine-5-)-methyltransferase n=2 Tax=Arcanobacterium TaxID=28263 RepID=A0A6H2EJS7_9ACTO|nr:MULTISPECIES: DNA (cytosine-5-)-methyltransferase [Arcanobacterium]QJC21223.1 DNA (cytosine-5-)-methyltransferase [Arcanobacterium buesumense]QRV02365.1 DNA (cytosine-5-)-methyltransferase [Arcanobacterium phocisimile]
MEKVQIGVAAQELGVSVDTIRRWAKQGLIKASRGARGDRLFNVDEIARLRCKLNGEGSQRTFEVLSRGEIFEDASCIDLFAGAGGTALGFHNAGLNHVFLNEFNKEAVSTLRSNSEKFGLNWDISDKDVHEVDFSTMSARVIQAGFPCQAFSYAGKSKGFADTRGTLFFEFARAVRDIQPDIAIGENVRGLVNHDGGRTLVTMLNTFDELGYDINFRILRAQYLDVPQKRERLFLFAVKRGKNLPIVFPKEQDYIITLREALEGVPDSPGQKYTAKKEKVMRLIPEGGNWRDLPDEIQKEYMGASYYLGGGKTGMARRMSWNEPALTLTCNPAQKQTERCHPEETRPFTVREYARIQTFPDEWEFNGSVAAQYKQIGNAVPVNLGYHMGLCVLASLGLIPIDETMEVVEPLRFPYGDLRN